MSQTVADASPLEERVISKNGIFGGGLFLEKDTFVVPLSWMQSSWTKNDKKPYMKIASELDKVIDTYYDLIGKDNTYLSSQISSNGREGTLKINHCNMDHYGLFVDTSIGVPINREMADIPLLGYVNYDTQSNEIAMTFEGAFGTMTKELLGPQTGPIHKEDKFDDFVDKLNITIDTLFIGQGFEPTPDKRHNLIGLCHNLSNSILEKEEVQKLIGVTPETVALDNPNLVRLAAKGITYVMIRIFCTSGVFPESTEELENLANMPVETLYGIWTGREKD